jgi:hypothetical protein
MPASAKESKPSAAKKTVRKMWTFEVFLFTVRNRPERLGHFWIRSTPNQAAAEQ